MRKIAIKQVDAFTDKPFGGNPAGVVTQAGELDDACKQNIAREMNLSETAFVSPSAVADFRVQFFTLNAEVDLCGHATIATFATLYEEGRLAAGRNVFHQETRAGVLPVEVSFAERGAVFMMTQAAPQYQPCSLGREAIAAMLGLQAEDLLPAEPQKVSTGLWWLVAGVADGRRLLAARPDFAAVERASREDGFVGIIAFSPETMDSECSFQLRAFCPLVGINEDPVCGTGCGCAAAYAADQGLLPQGQFLRLTAEAGLAVGRPGRVRVEVLREEGRVAAVKVGGQAVTVLQGEMTVTE